MNNKLMALFAITALLIAPFAVNSAIAQESTTASVTVPATCGATVGSNLVFGNLANAQTALDRPLIISNAGNIPVTSVSVSGTDWLDITSTSQMNVGQTTHDANPGTAGTALSATPTAIPNLSSIAVSGNAATSWDLTMSVAPTFQGGLTQVITISPSCV